MPILNEETEERVAGDVTEATMGVVAAMLIGKELKPETLMRGRLVPPRLARDLTPLERSYLAGKVANVVGPAKVRKMTKATLDKWIATRLRLTEKDLAKLEALKGRTRRWLRGRTEDWQRRNRAAIERASTRFDADNAAIGSGQEVRRVRERGRSLRGLTRSLQGEAVLLTGEMDRMIQTDAYQYFQSGQMSDVDGEELVYKIPRPSAEIQCMRLHISATGEPIKYTLAEVQGNSNIGAAPDDWVFTIGPVHPNCYCVLFREIQTPSPSKSAGMARNRQAAVQRQRDQAQRRDERIAVREKKRITSLERALIDQPEQELCCAISLPLIKSLL